MTPSDQPAPEHAPPGAAILLGHQEIQARVGVLSGEISRYYHGKRPLLIGVMNGALFFLADLVRRLELDVEICCVSLASYRGRESTGQLTGLEMLGAPVRGRHVLIVDDILDTGLTLSRLAARLHELGAADIRICVLLEKRRIREAPVHADWIGFEMGDEFVVGYGLDLDGRYRGLEAIWNCPPPTPALT